MVPLVRLDTDLGQQIRDGLVNLPYVDREVDAVAAVRVPIERVQAAAGVDAQTVLRYLVGRRKATPS